MFKQDESMLRFGAMALDHLFIQDYLPAARGDYVKVYIYGLYLSQHPREELGLAELAHELSMSEAEVEAALRYWERRRLVTRLNDNPPQYAFRSAAQLAFSGDKGLEADPEYVAFSENIYVLFDERRSIRPSEIALAWEWVQDLGLPQDVVMMLLSHMAKHSINFSFKTAEKEAVRMCEAHIVTTDDAENYFAHSRSVQEGARKVLSRLGKRRAASEPELALYRKWVDEWRYTPEAILEACAETTKGEPTFAYLDGILNGIRQRAQQQDAAPRTPEALRSQLSAEKDEQTAARAFAQALGLRTLSGMVRQAYQALCAQYDAEVVLLSALEAHKNGGDLDTVSRTLEHLSRRGIRTAPEARAYFDEVHSLNQALLPVFEACGLSGRPTASDRTLYKKWQGWGFGQEMLLLAAQQARSVERKLPYMDKILESWHAAGVTSADQAAARKAPRAARGRQVTAQQYAQREYTEEELQDNSLLEEALKEHE